MNNTERRQHEIAEVFKQCTISKPSEKRVTVVEITDALNIDRKTFYHYFESVDNIAIWIYRDHLRNMLHDPVFYGCEFVKPHSSLHDPFPDWPFYARFKDTDHFLAQAPFYETMVHHFIGNRDYYSKVFHYKSVLPVYDYIINLFLPSIKEDVIYMLNGREMPEVAINFLAEYHAMGIFGRLRYHFVQSGWNINQDEIQPYWNYAHTTLKQSIECLFEKVSNSTNNNSFEQISWRYRGKLL